MFIAANAGNYVRERKFFRVFLSLPLPPPLPPQPPLPLANRHATNISVQILLTVIHCPCLPSANLSKKSQNILRRNPLIPGNKIGLKMSLVL